METLNVAVVGLGKLGLLHAGIVNGLPGSRLAAVVDSSAMIRDTLASRMEGLRLYGDHHELLTAGGIDAVFIATPTSLHIPIALDCVNADVPVFIEKPLAIDSQQAAPLLEALRSHAVPTMVGYMGRYNETFAKAQQLIASGALGTLQMLRSSMYVSQLFRAGKGWRYEKEHSGGGVMITQNAHVIDKLLWMFGDVDSVSAQTASLYSPTVEDYAHVYFRFRSGLVGYMDASWSARHYRAPAIGIHVQGSRGTLDVDDDAVRLFLDEPHGDLPAAWSVWRKPDLYQGATLDIGGTFYTFQAEAFLAAVRGAEGAHVRSDVASAYATQRVLDAAYASAGQQGAPVQISAMS